MIIGKGNFTCLDKLSMIELLEIHPDGIIPNELRKEVIVDEYCRALSPS